MTQPQKLRGRRELINKYMYLPLPHAYTVSLGMADSARATRPLRRKYTDLQTEEALHHSQKSYFADKPRYSTETT